MPAAARRPSRQPIRQPSVADVPAPASRPPARGRRGLAELAAAEAACTNCDLYKHATQVVPGQGPAAAQLILVGEQPGDQEDRAGAPFVGPAGAVLARALAGAAIDRRAVFVTNAVKHFKWEPRGKRRIHQTPRWSEIRACRPWLDAELALVTAPVIVTLGAIAAKAMLGPAFRLTGALGTVQPGPGGRPVVATYHPSAILRAIGDDRERLFGQLVADLKRAARLGQRRAG
jgi:uracil-DNA glycosylase family protein